MATIKHSELAPSEKVHYILGNVEFDLTAKGTFKTDDFTTLGHAEAHPWLVVEPDASPTAAAEAETAAKEEVQPVAIEAGKNQDKRVVTEGVAETLAADPTDTKAGKN